MIRSITRQFNASGLAAIVLLLLGMFVAWRGYWITHDDFSLEQVAADFYANGAAELGSIAITVLVIETLNARRAIRREKADLILNMGSPDNTVAREAVRKLGIRGWLQDGSCRGVVIINANLQKTGFWKADLQNAKLPMANLDEAQIKASNLQAAGFQKASLRGLDVQDSNLKNVNFWEANLQEARMAGINLQGATLRDSNLYRANLSGANLQDTRCWDATLEEAILTNADLQGADLRSANLQKARLLGVNFQGAKLKGANLREAIIWDGDPTKPIAQFNEETQLPDGTYWNSGMDMTRFTDPSHPDFWRSDNPNSPAYHGQADEA